MMEIRASPGEGVVASSQRCCGDECIGGSDHLMLATRRAARPHAPREPRLQTAWPAAP